jgi:glycosyltransferase involved in cell wall biosynthesis
MIRLFIVQPFGERRGGSDNVLLTFLRHLDRTSFEPRVVFLEPGAFVGEIAATGTSTVTLPGGRMRHPAHVIATALRLARILRRDRPDLVLNWLSTAHVYCAPAAKRAGLADRCVWWQHDLPARRPPPSAGRRGWLEWARAQAVGRIATALPARAVGACSHAAADAQARLRPRRPAIAVLPGIDPPAEATPAELASLRARLGIPERAFVVGTVGRLVAWKGHHLVLRAIAELRRRGVPAFGLVVGGGHQHDARYEDQLKRLADELGLERSLVLTGQVPNATAYLQLMDAFVNAASPEPFGLAIVEAMALGVPVVAVAAGGPAEIIRDRESGLLVDSDGPQDLAAALAELAGDQALCARIAAAARERHRARFTGERMTREMERVLAGFVP